MANKLSPTQADDLFYAKSWNGRLARHRRNGHVTRDSAMRAFSAPGISQRQALTKDAGQRLSGLFRNPFLSQR